MPTNSPSADVNFPVLHLLLTSLNYEGAQVAKDISRGLPIAGGINKQTFPKPNTPQLLSISDWLANTEARNKRIVRQPSEPGDFKLPMQRWPKSMVELSKNWITEHEPITNETLRDIPLTPRFAINEQHGIGPEKIRLIDDCEISELNKTLELFEKSVPVR